MISGTIRGRATEADSLYVTAAYLTEASNTLAELFETLSGLFPNIVADGDREVLRRSILRPSDTQVTTFGVYELAPSRYEDFLNFKALQELSVRSCSPPTSIPSGLQHRRASSVRMPADANYPLLCPSSRSTKRSRRAACCSGSQRRSADGCSPFTRRSGRPRSRSRAGTRLLMSVPPEVRVGRSHAAWMEIGASSWLVRKLRFGLQLPWVPPVQYRRPRQYPMSPEAGKFTTAEVARCMDNGFICRLTTKRDQLCYGAAKCTLRSSRRHPVGYAWSWTTRGRTSLWLQGRSGWIICTTSPQSW